MENKDQNNALSLDGAGDDGLSPTVDGVHLPPPALDALSLDEPATGTPGTTLQEQPKSQVKTFLRFARRLDVLLVMLLVVGGVVVFLNATLNNKRNNNPAPTVANSFNTIKIPLNDLLSGKDLTLAGAANVTINGPMQLNDAFLLAPSLQPTGAKPGQIYYDQGNNQLAYFNGNQFVFLPGAAGPAGVQNIGGATGQLTLGDGLVVAGGQLSNTGVLAVQGVTGNVTLTAGPGIVINGTNFSNTGVLSVASGSPNVTVSNDGNGNVTVSMAGAGSGTVASSGGTAGTIPLFTGSQNIEDSIITQSGLTVTINGDLSVVTGGLSLSNALTVSNGGSGATSLASNGVLVGQGTAAITSVTSGAAGLCLLSTVGVPTWAACPSSSGVASLNSLIGALNIANASGAGTTITIDNASTVAKGIASFNNNNFTVSGGAVNTIQDINATATPTFAGVNTNIITPSAALTVGISAQTALLQGSVTSITSSGVGNDIILNSADTIELQDNTNVTGNVVASGDVAVNGGDLTSTGALNITPAGTLTAGSAGQTLTLQGGAATSFRATSGGNTTIVGFTNPVANTTLNFPALAAGTYTICTTSGNCAGAAATLQGAYDNSTSPEIILDATRGALTIRDNATPIGGNLLEVQNNTGSATYLAVTSAGVTVAGTVIASGNVNTSSGALQTGGTTRLDNAGNAVNIGSLTLSGAISGGTTYTGSGNINTTGGAIQTNGVSRIDTTGNLINIASITASGSATLQGGGLTLGTNSQAGSVVINDGSANTGTLQVAALGQNTIYTLPDPGVGTATICLTTGNCAGSGGGVTSGGGTLNRLAKFSGSQAITDSSITDDGTNVTVATDIIVQGGDLTVGTTSQTASLLLHDGNGQTTTLQAGNSAGNLIFILPTNTGVANQCLKQSGTGNQLVWQDCDGGAGGSSATLQTAYNNSTTPEIVLNSSVGGLIIRDNATPIGGSLLAVQNNAGSTTYFNVTTAGVGVTGTATATGNVNSSGGGLQTNSTTRLDNAGNAVNIGNITGSGAITIASTGAGNDIIIDGADQFIVQDASVFNALSTFNANIDIGANDIIGTTGNINLTNFDVTGTTGNVAAGTYNGQTISAAANFTGTVAVAGNVTLAADIAVNGGDLTSSSALNITPGGTLTVGAAGQQLILQGNANTKLTATGGGFTTTVGFTGTPSSSVTYNFDRTATGGPYTICTTFGNCVGTGGGVTTAGGTIGTLAKFTGAQALGDSLISESGSVVTVNGNLNLTTGNQFRVNGTQISSANLSNDADLAKLSASQTFTGNTVAFRNGTNSTNAFNVQNALGARVLTVDTANSQVVLGVGSTMDGKLVFNSVSSANTVTILPGTPTANRTITLPDASGIICTDSGNCMGAGATLQTSYNFSVGGTTPKIKVNSTLLGVDIQDADTTIAANLFNVRASNGAGLGSVMLGVGNTGQVTLQNSANSTTALRLLTAGGTSVLVGDTTNGRIVLGQSSTLSGTIVFNNATNANTTTLIPATAAANRTITLPDASGTICLTIGNCSGVGSSSTLQAAYDAGNTILSSDGRDVNIALADTATDANLLVDLQCDTSCSTNGRFAIQDDGTDVFTVSPAGGAALLKNSVNSTTALRVQQAAAGSTVITVDTTNGELELGQSSALSGKLVFNNSTNANTITLVTPAAASSRTITLPDETGTICLQSSTNCGFAPSAGSGAYIRNGTTVQAANFFIQNASGTSADTAVIQQSTSQTGKLLRVENTAGSTDLLAVGPDSFSVNTTLAGDTGAANTLVSNISPVTALINGNLIRTIVSPGATASGLILGTSNALETGNNASYTANLIANLGQVNWSSTGTSTTGRLSGVVGKVASTAGAGAISTAVGVQAEGQFQSPVTDYFGLYSTMNSNTNVAIQNAYGLKIDDFAATGGTAPTNFYAIVTDGGQVRLRATSATAFQLQNSAGAETLFTADTTARSASGGNLIKIGNSTGTDTATTILKLDATTTDPVSSLAALNGGLFYNSTTNKVSIVENGAVKVVCNKTDLGCGSAATTTLQGAYDNSSSPASVTTVAGKDVLFNMTDVAPAPNFLVDLQCDTSCPSSGRFAIQDDGVDTFRVSPAGGSALFKNSVNSATAFQIQNFATTPMFLVDTLNNAVYIGNPSGDVTGVPLVLDTKTDAGDPTGVNGGMYYNSSLHEYRCYRGINGTAADGAWEPCATNPMDRGYDLEEEFMSGDTATATIGQLGWSLAGNGTNTLQYNDSVNGDGDHPGIFHITTGAVSGNGDVIFLGGNGAGNTSMKINGTQVVKAGVRTGPTVANAVIRVGIYTTSAASTSPNSGVWWEADASTNANWRYCYGNGTTPTCTATASPAVAVTAATWSSLEIRVTAVGTNTSSVDFFINNGATMTKYSVSGVTVDSVNGLAPALSCWTSTAASKNCFFDYFQMRGTSSARR